MGFTHLIVHCVLSELCLNRIHLKSNGWDANNTMKDPRKEWQEEFYGYEAQNEGTGPYLSSSYSYPCWSKNEILSLLHWKSMNVDMERYQLYRNVNLCWGIFDLKCQNKQKRKNLRYHRLINMLANSRLLLRCWRYIHWPFSSGLASTNFILLL